jgi:hypothetical protein
LPLPSPRLLASSPPLPRWWLAYYKFTHNRPRRLTDPIVLSALHFETPSHPLTHHLPAHDTYRPLPLTTNTSLHPTAFPSSTPEHNCPSLRSSSSYRRPSLLPLSVARPKFARALFTVRRALRCPPGCLIDLYTTLRSTGAKHLRRHDLASISFGPFGIFPFRVDRGSTSSSYLTLFPSRICQSCVR